MFYFDDEAKLFEESGGRKSCDSLLARRAATAFLLDPKSR
eukprot:CAMPEP_0173382044 /NCGR_PEP_ID=MMETSP1356-20130122/4515_1 /TAXON_ID=77927 ORGANISM="Hemiselmis virescens, Strain PCC157" /NCGR_SAMPLE_ID=MMETSP1356 /ASSEMBLY_ACC=CAM_ASM_000847 /LENGTH=39 /DNA_ID= /DNA_START= /DNA_END= /DNA_ORIENTATION=